MNQPHDRTATLPFRLRLAGLAASLLLLLLVLGTDVERVMSAEPALRLIAPHTVQVGHPFEVQIVVEGISTLGGYETILRYDESALHFSGLRQRQNDLDASGGEVTPLGPVLTGSSAAFGLVSCPARDCLRLQRSVDRALPPAAHLATLTLVADRPGLIDLRLDETRLVDRQGTPLYIALAAQLTIQAGDAEGVRYPAPSPRSAWAPSGTPRPARGAAELTGDGRLSYADLMELALGWELSRHLGAPCAPGAAALDLTGEGCLDVGDLQLMAASLTSPVATSSGEAEEPQSALALFTVNSTGDEPDSNIGNGICSTAVGSCTLRAAIHEANARSGPDTILFNIPGGALHTIQLDSELPTLSDDSGGTTIDGYSQPGAAANSDPLASNARIRVQVRGAGGEAFDGLRVTSAGNTVRGLALFNLRRPFWLYGSGARNNLIVGNFIGTDAGGLFGHSQSYNLAHGIHMEQGAASNQVGDIQPADRNVISGNGQTGIGLWHEGTNDNIAVNNIVGLTPSGEGGRSNNRHGMDFNFGAAGNRFGGTGLGQRNVISGNVETGVEISHTTGTRDNQVLGNFIGTDLTGNNAPPYAANGARGVLVEDGATENTVAWNVIANNGMGGIEVFDSITLNNTFHDNRIGVGLDGTPLPNQRFGIFIKGQHTMVGPNNIVAHSEFAGIKLSGDSADFNTITRNSIYANGNLGIDLPPLGPPTANDSGDLDSGPNEQLNFPVLDSVNTLEARGSACAGCTIELFIADSSEGEHGEGRQFVGAATARSNGTFIVPLAGVQVGDPITATATDPDGNTSEFSLNRAAIAAPPTATPTATRTPTATPTVTRTPVDPRPYKLYLPVIARR